MMKTKRFFWLMLMLVASLAVASCSDDNDDDSGKKDDNDSTGQVTGDYTATTKVKKMVLGENYNRKFVIYEDYYRKYAIGEINGTSGVTLIQYNRVHSEMVLQDGRVGKPTECDIQIFPSASSLSDISEHIKVSENYYSGFNSYTYYYRRAEFSPNCGFACVFTTGKGELKYMRMRAVDYTLDKNSTVETITLEYQLY